MQIEIESLAYGGAGVGRLRGEVFFVQGSAPGELVEVEATRRYRRHREARLLEVLRASPERVVPPCPHFGSCGGCQWQHLSARAQLEAKLGALTEALVRVGKVPRERLAGRVTALAAPAQYGYRRRCRFEVDARGRLCFHELGGMNLVAIERCDLLSPALRSVSEAIGAALAGQPITGLTHVELCEAAGHTAAEAVLEPAAFTAAARASLESWRAAPVGLAGIVVREGDRVIAELGTPQLEEPPLLLRPDVFSQPSQAGSELLRAQAIEAAGIRAGDWVLELYCGSGNFTFALAELGREVCAIEQDGHALRLARKALPAPLQAKIDFIEGDAASLAPRWSREPGFDVAVLDPPRAGARPLLEPLARAVRRRIAYVSCDPATLARDVAVLEPLGFELTRAVVLDLFPQTYHLETVATLDSTHMMEQRLVEFASLLRQGGLRVSPGELVDAVRGLELVELEERDEFRSVLRCSLLKRVQDAPTFDRSFDLFFGGTVELVADLERGLVERLRESGLLDPDSLEMLAYELAHRALSPLAQAALEGDVGKLARLLRGAVLQLNLKGATVLQQGFFGRRLGSAAGLPDAARELAEIEAGLRARGIDPGALELIADQLAGTLRSLERTVRDLISLEIAARRPLLRSGLDERPFASVGPDELRAMEAAVRRLAAKLKTRFVRRERSRRKGALNVRRTLRRNLSTGGFPNHLVFRTRRPHRPDVVVLCDVSDSVRNASRLMLLFVHSLQTLFQRVRSFAFVSDLGELTEQLRESDASAAIDIGSIGRAVNLASNSNYGHVFQLFVKRHLAAVTRRTTVLILGDGRNNYNPVHAWALRDLRLKARRVIWISPEPRSSWRLGDSAMLAYERECTQVEVVTCLADLEQLADRLVPV